MNPATPEQARRPARTAVPWVIGGITLAVMAATAAFLIALARAIPPAALDVGDTGTVLRVPLPIGDFALVDQDGKAFDHARLEGRWSFLFFGYTSCPAICPMTLGNLSDVKKLVAGDPEFDGDEIQFVFVSVDPERDSRERLRDFVPYFDSEFIGVTGSPDQLEALTEALGIHHHVVEGGTERDYLVDHTTSILLIDPAGSLHAIFPVPHDPGAVAEAFHKIRQHRG